MSHTVATIQFCHTQDFNVIILAKGLLFHQLGVVVVATVVGSAVVVPSTVVVISVIVVGCVVAFSVVVSILVVVFPGVVVITTVAVHNVKL